MEQVTLGRIINLVGLQGELKIDSLSDFSNLRYRKGAIVQVEIHQQMKPFTIKRYRTDGRFDYVMLEEIATVEEAKKLLTCYVYAEKRAIALSEGYFFYGDLVGCLVTSTEGVIVGTVQRVEEIGPQKSLRVSRGDKPSFLIPFVKAFIERVDIAKKTITVHVIGGML